MQRLSPLVLLVALTLGCGGSKPSAADAPTDAVPDTAVAETPTPDTAGEGDAAPPARGLGIDWSTAPSGAAPRYEATPSGFLDRPWPTDQLRAADGTIDLSGFPNPDQVDILTAYIEYGEEALRGWGLNGSVYFRLDGPLDPSSLPSPTASRDDPKAVAQLVNVTPKSKAYGKRWPLVFAFHQGTADPYLPNHTLALRPVFGFPLTEGETHCAILTRAIKDASGKYLARPETFSQALETDPSLAPLAAWLPSSQLLPEDLAAATCFSTDRPTHELQKVREFLLTAPPPTLLDITYLGAADKFHEFNGHYAGRNFQSGVKPYRTEGGDLKFDAAGLPIVQAEEPIRYKLMVPKSVMPATGWPVVLYAHGTGGNFESCLDDGTAPALIELAFAVICIDQPLHGERGDESWDPVTLSFNFQNPRAGRMSFRQSAIDTIDLAIVVANGSFDLEADSLTGYGKDIRYDGDNIFFFGHSHGGLSGALVFGVDPIIKGGLLSGAGGVIIETVLRRKDPIDFQALAIGILGAPEESFDTFHPALSLIQLLVDATDPVNYARYWLRPTTGTPKHVFVTEGVKDAATPSVGTDAMLACAGVPFIQPVVQASPAHDLLGMKPVETPLQLNLYASNGKPYTAAGKQWEFGDHFVVFTENEARCLWGDYFKSISFSIKQDEPVAPVISCE
jgi:hypothetical protein